MDSFRLCAICRHLEVVESGREFENIADTEYMVFRCKWYAVTVRDDYLMKLPEQALTNPGKDPDCPNWEHWSGKTFASNPRET